MSAGEGFTVTTTTRPPYDPELRATMDLMPTMPPLTVETLPMMRANQTAPPIESALSGRPLQYTDYVVPGHDGAEIQVSVIRRSDHQRTDGAAVYLIHGGGMIMGDRSIGAGKIANWVEEYDIVAATVEYRLAPEFPDPVPVEDCYAGFSWFADQGQALGFDSRRILITGGSAGGGLAAGVTLLARDRKGILPVAEVLDSPMIDDRDATASSQQFSGFGIWDREANAFGWSSLLGDRVNDADVSIYAAPARASDLGGLPATFLDVGSAEVFRDETIEYAQKIWAAGGQAELHVYEGGFHGYEFLAPSAEISTRTLAARESWVKRYLAD
jgi:acetyl esterase/lipase